MSSTVAPPGPDSRTWVVLGVDGEHPSGIDDRVIDVSTPWPGRNGGQDPPPGISRHHLGRGGGDLYLPIGPDPPGTFLGVHLCRGCQKRFHRRGLSCRSGSRPRGVGGRIGPRPDHRFTLRGENVNSWSRNLHPRFFPGRRGCAGERRSSVAVVSSGRVGERRGRECRRGGWDRVTGWPVAAVLGTASGGLMVESPGCWPAFHLATAVLRAGRHCGTADGLDR